MTAFAVSFRFPSNILNHLISRIVQTGGLLSDVFLHLVPHAFLGEHQDSGAHLVMVEDKRNILIGYVNSDGHIPTTQYWLVGLVFLLAFLHFLLWRSPYGSLVAMKELRVTHTATPTPTHR